MPAVGRLWPSDYDDHGDQHNGDNGDDYDLENGDDVVMVMVVLKIKPPSKYFCKACFDLRLIENNAARMALEFGNNLGNAAQVGLFPNIGTGLTLEFVERIFHIS